MKKKIFVVDDDRDILEPMSILLKEYGYTVDTTPKGEETYKKVTKFKPDVILLDILMSGNDGRKICKTLKSDEKTKNIRIVMMSAHPGADADSQHCGADDFIAKPFETDDLLKVIEQNI